MKPRRVFEKMLMPVGINLFSHGKEDRRVLEQIILPSIAADERYQRILFVGCEYYTRPYNRLFRGREFWTIDSDPKHARYGSSRHVVDVLERLDLHFPAAYFDAIICNGVFGWGLNTREAAEIAFAGCHRCLAAGGLFVLGWDDLEKWRPFPPSECISLRKFDPYCFQPLGTSQYRTATAFQHVYNFFTRPVEVGTVMPTEEQRSVPAS